MGREKSALIRRPGRLIEDIASARHHVHLQFFIFNGDSTGQRVAAALAAAASRGVDCRLLVDAFGCRFVARCSQFRTLGVHLALHAAVLRGVRLDLILPEKSDQRAADAAARGYLDELLRSGANVHLFTAGLLHTKSMTVDDRLAILGSANFDRRSLFLNYETNVAIYDSGFAVELRENQERYLTQSVRLEREWWAREPALRRRVYELARLLSPLI